MLQTFLDVNVKFDVNQAIKDAEAALGKYGPAIWSAALHQVQAQAGLALFWGVFGTALTIVFLVLAVMGLIKGDWHEGDRWVAISFIGMTLAIIFFIVAALNLSTWYTLATAPDWAALQLLKP